MNRTALALALVAALAIGASAGLVGGVVIARLRPDVPFLRHEPPPFERRLRAPRGGGPEFMLPRLAQALDLTPEQRERILALMRETGREHQAVRESMSVRIERELTPAQRERWNQIQSRINRRMRGGALAPPPPDDGP